MVKDALIQQLKVPRQPRTYSGRKKPVNGGTTYSATPPIASGNLIENIDVFWRENQAGDPELIVEMPYYWVWVNDGRKPGRYPPLGVIDRWSVQKGLSGIRDEKGRFIPRKTLNFLRARSIAKYGFRGTFFVDKAIKQIETKVQKEFGDGALAYVQELLKESLAIKIDVKL